MPHANTEDQLVEQPAIQLFAAMGWETMSALDEVMGPTGTLGRETTAEVVLVSRLRAALERLNPTVPPEALAIAIDTLTRNRSTMSLVAANREVYDLLKNGISVSVPDREHGGQKTERVRIIDWLNPRGNDFLLVSQMTITGALYTCRPDLIGFVNGLPLVVVELKKPGVPAKQAFDDNLTSYKHPQNGIPDLFWYNALLIASNGIESRVGTLTADWERFFEWKRVEREDEPRRVSLEVMLRGVCDPVRLLDLVENFTLFSEERSGLIKILAQNHQVLGVNKAIPAMLEARAAGHGRGGVFWHTPGGGQEPVDGLLRAEDPAAHRGQLDVRDRDRPRGAGRPDRQDVQGDRGGQPAGEPSVPRRERRGAARAAAGQSPVRLHADPQVPDAGDALRPPRRRSSSPTRRTAASTTRWP